MPAKADNRLATSDSLKTHDIWQNSVKYDPYAGANEGQEGGAVPEIGEINSSAKGLFRLAQLTGNSSTLAPGACKRCGQVGHLFFQCRNYMAMGNKGLNDPVAEDDEEDPPSDANPMSSSAEEEDSDDSDDSDSESGSGSDSSGSGSDSESESSSSSPSAKKKKKKKRKHKEMSKKEKKSKADKPETADRERTGKQERKDRISGKERLDKDDRRDKVARKEKADKHPRREQAEPNSAGDRSVVPRTSGSKSTRQGGTDQDNKHDERRDGRAGAKRRKFPEASPNGAANSGSEEDSSSGSSSGSDFPHPSPPGGTWRPAAHRTSHATASALKQERAKPREALASARAPVSFDGEVCQIEVASYRDFKEELWASNPEANVTCEGCKRQVPQQQGRLRGELGRPKLMLDEFLCSSCAEGVLVC